LRHLHDRSLQAAERRRQIECVASMVELAAERPVGGDTRSDAADIDAHARIALGAGGEAIFLGVARRRRHAADL